MQTQIIQFPSITTAERRAMSRPPDPDLVRMATNHLITALYNYRRITSGEADDFAGYLDVPPVKREYFYREWAVPIAIEAIWREGEAS